MYLKKVKIHAAVGCRHGKQRHPVIVLERLYRPVGVEIEMVIVLVALLGHVRGLQGRRVHAQGSMQRTRRGVSASRVTVLVEQHHLEKFDNAKLKTIFFRI